MKIAAYCRVSTEKSDQINSYIGQIRYFSEITERNTEWELYNIYADEGISGTSTSGRSEFNRMISDAYDGKFQLIVTKEVSRFSRNILDTIAYTRELKRLGVGVIFLTDGINTLDADSELRLSIMSCIAQEESRKTSERVKWGQTRQMEKGVVFGRSLLGYTVKSGKMAVEPIGAELVRSIFSKYVFEQKGTTVISREMEEMAREMGIIRQWTPAYISKVLKNEKYAGDLLQKKTVTPDYLTHTKKYNRGEESQIYIRDHHEPIVDREVWNEAQSRLERRNKQKGGTSCSVRYAFSGRIKCGVCKKSFVSRNRSGKNGKYKTWVCGGSLASEVNRGEKCTVGVSVRDFELYSMVKLIISLIDIDRGKLLKIVMDACDNSNISEARRREISKAAESLLSGETVCDAIVKQLVETVFVYPDKHCEVKLKNTDSMWTFVRDNHRETM
ncbi:MAG: recombinase family protein [Ruminococcaceae bacterium]|nr:recombinase family protein [Oscillospiraceae bacterium]